MDYYGLIIGSSLVISDSQGNVINTVLLEGMGQCFSAAWRSIPEIPWIIH